LNSGLSKVDGAKHHNHHYAKVVHRVKEVVSLIHNYSPIRLPTTTYASMQIAASCIPFFIESEAKITGGISEISIDALTPFKIVMNYFLDTR
jgi:hypothetical protein